MMAAIHATASRIRLALLLSDGLDSLVWVLFTVTRLPSPVTATLKACRANSGEGTF